MSEQLNDHELQAFADDLKRLSPITPPMMDRDRLMYRAGQESLRLQRRAWMLSSALLFVSLASVSAVLLWQMQRAPLERIQVVVVREVKPADPPPPAIAPSPPLDVPEEQSLAYLQLRRQVQRLGVDVVPDLPTAPPSQEAQLSPRTLLALHTHGRTSSLLPWFTPSSGEQE